MTNALKKTMASAGATYGLDMLHAHCATVNSYKWVQQSGKRYVVVRGEDGKHYLDFRKVHNASEHGAHT
jgi:hypothetical protein